MCCSFVFATVQKAWSENLVRHNKGLILGSRKQVIFKNSRSLASAFPDAACPFIFLISLWPASVLQIWILSHPLPGRETRLRNVFLLSSWKLTTLPFCHSKYFTAFHHEQLQGLLLKQNHVGITQLLSVWLLLTVFLLPARETSSVVLPSFIIRCLTILVIQKCRRSAGFVCRLGTPCLHYYLERCFLSLGDYRSGGLSEILYFSETDDISHLAFWIISNDRAADFKSPS